MNQSSDQISAFIASTPLGSPRSTPRIQKRPQNQILYKDDRSGQAALEIDVDLNEKTSNPSLLNRLVWMIEERKFPEAMAIIYRLRRFEDVYKATAENENLKIQVSAAESTAENILAEHERLRKLLEIKDGLIKEGKNEITVLKKNLSSTQDKNDHLNELLVQKERETKQILSTYEDSQRTSRNTASKLDREIISLKMNIKSQQKTIKKLESELNLISQENETLQTRLKDSQVRQKDKNNKIESLEIQNKDYVEKMGEITNQIGEERAREKQREVGNMLLERIDVMLSRSRGNPQSSGSRSFEKQLEKRKSAVSKFVAEPNKL